MKFAITHFLTLFICYSSFSQVGIGNTDPKAQLDISAGTMPSAKDGILIPRLDEFPTGVDSNQDGMLLFITGNGTPTKGFYYWNNDTTGWITVGNSDVEKIDDLSDGKSDALGSSIFLGVGSGANDDGTNNQNIGIGFESLKNNTDGFWNIGIGYQALLNNTGNGNITLGWLSMTNNTIGQSNLALGNQALQFNINGNYNTAIGTYSLLDNISGNQNVAIGGYALANITNETENTAVGTNAGRDSSGESNVFLGYSSGYFESGSNKLYIENSNADEDNALIYGEFDNKILRTNSEFQIGNPTGTGYALPTTDGSSGQVLSTDGSGQISFETPNVGAEKIDDLLDGKSDNSSMFLGTSAGENDNGNNSNFGLGVESMYNNINGIANTALGYRSLYNNIDGNSNLCLGFESLYDNIDGSRNIAIGSASLSNNISGNDNLAIGYGAFTGNTNGSNNIAIGSAAGPSNGYLGDSGIFLGESSGRFETQSNRLYIENSNANSDNALIYGEFDNNILRTNSEFQIGNPTGTGYALPTTDGTSGQVLSTNGNGQLSFGTIEEDADWYKEGTTTAPNSITDNIYTEGNVAIDGETYISDKLGIGSGAEDPDGYLEVRANNSVAQPNLKLVDIGSSGARISFTNTVTTNGNAWTLFGDTSNTTSSNLFHLFHTNAGNILTAKGDGDVGIKGTPNADFHVYHGNSGTSDGFKLQNSTDNTWWRFYVSSGSDDLRLYNSNNGTTMMGAFNDATGAYSSTSDRRLKKDFKTLHFSWHAFMQLKPLTYKYKKDQKPTNYIGMVAQDVEKIYPELVSYKAEEDIYHMDYSATGVVAIKATQKLKNEVNKLEKKIESLALENSKLKVELSKYKSIEQRLQSLEKLNSIALSEVAKSKN